VLKKRIRNGGVNVLIIIIPEPRALISYEITVVWAQLDSKKELHGLKGKHADCQETTARIYYR
jgi:hypothetical protein